MSESTVYISKKCPYCIKLLQMFQQIPEVKGSVKIVSIEDNPYPSHIIKAVPTMISNGELWNADELFQVIEQKIRRLNTQKQQSPERQLQQQMMDRQPQQQSQQQEKEVNNDIMFDGYVSNDSALGYASLDGNENILSESMFESIETNQNKESINYENDGYLPKVKKAAQFDNDYERMMKERGEILPNRPR